MAAAGRARGLRLDCYVGAESALSTMPTSSCSSTWVCSISSSWTTTCSCCSLWTYGVTNDLVGMVRSFVVVLLRLGHHGPDRGRRRRVWRRLHRQQRPFLHLVGNVLGGRLRRGHLHGPAHALPCPARPEPAPVPVPARACRVHVPRLCAQGLSSRTAPMRYARSCLHVCESLGARLRIDYVRSHLVSAVVIYKNCSRRGLGRDGLVSRVALTVQPQRP